MRPLILALLTLSMAGCSAPKTETVIAVPNIPAETRTPCPISDRMVQTVNELAVLATEHRQSAECANGKIEAIDKILTGSEASQ